MSSSPPGVRNRILVAVLMLLAVFAPVTAAAARSAPTVALPVVSPAPQSMRATGTDTVVSGNAAVVTAPGSDAAATKTVTAVLRAAGANVLPLKALAPVPSSVGLTVYVGGLKENTGSGAALKRLKTTGTSGLHPEGYVIASGPVGRRFDVVLAGADPAGTFYAAQTFRQLVHSVKGHWHMPGVVVRDEPGLERRGIIEGFYGLPWSAADRNAMMRFAGQNKMDSYVYAPKFDPYHREQWKTPYPAAQLKELGALVATARANHVDFTFAVSPGLSICFSDDGDFAALEKKTQAMYDLGVRSFALFFDDITPVLGCDADKAKFGSDASPTAAAQAYLLNRFREKFIATHAGAEPLATVPTEYYGVTASPYKTRFAELVNADVHMYWTGQGVISPTITDADLSAAHALFKHPIEVWDNFPVNDYAPSRLFLGPVDGRGQKPADDGVTGFLSNPMTQAIPSQLAETTIADMTWNPGGYDPKRSWNAALDAVGGSASGALRTFADNNLSSALSTTESPDLAPGIAAFEKEFAGGTPTSSAALAAKFDKLAKATPALEHAMPAAFTAEAGPWLAKSAAYGSGGAAAVRSLTAQKKGDDTTAWRERIKLDTAVKAGQKYSAIVGEKVFEPFVTWAQQQSDRVTLKAPTPGTVLNPGSDVTLSASVKPGSVGIGSVRFYAGSKLVGTATKAPYDVVWQKAPRTLAQIRVQATDTTGATIQSTPVNLKIGTPDDALFVVGSTSAPSQGELITEQRLNYLGLSFTPKAATQVTADDAKGKALIFVSPNVTPTDLKVDLASTEVPMVVDKADLYAGLGMAASSGPAYGAQKAEFKSSPLSGGLTGTVDVYKQPDIASYGSGLGSSAIVAATVPGSADKVLVFGYERGATMAKGTAPARRVGLFLSEYALWPTQTEPATKKVFDTAVTWAIAH